MNTNWSESMLQDVADVVNGGTPKTKVSDFWGGDHLWITPAEMGKLESPYLEISRRTLSEEGLKNSSASLVPAYSVVLSTRAPIGHLVINTKPMAFNQGCRGVVPGDSLHHKFLYYFLIANVRRLDDLGSGTTFKELSAGKLKKFSIPVPSMDEQKRIVAILDEAFAGIDKAMANTEKNLANARELFESYRSKGLDRDSPEWRRVKLGDEIDLLTGFAFKSKHYTADPKDIALLRGDNIVQGQLRWRNAKRWPRDDIGEFKKYELRDGDVVLAMDRTWVKAGIKYAQITESDLPCLLVQRVARLRTKQTLLPEYLGFLIGSKKFESYVLSIQTGLGVPHISGKQINEFEFSAPPAKAQAAIVERIKDMKGSLQRLEELYETKLNSLGELKKSLLHKAFSGELTPDKSHEQMQEAVTA